MGGNTVLIEIYTLPRAECQLAVAYRQVETAVREDAADMGGHVIASLGIMAKDGIAVPDQATEKGFEIATHRRVGVLAQDQRGAGVLDEYVA